MRIRLALLLGIIVCIYNICVFSRMQQRMTSGAFVPPDPTRPHQEPATEGNADAGPHRLEFVHITKTAGSSIEEAAARSGIRWGACHWKKISTFGSNCTGAWRKRGRGRPVYNHTRIPGSVSRGVLGEPWHVPHRWFRLDPYEGSRTFVVVRDPYERCVSEYYSRWGGYEGRDRNDPAVMNDVLRRRVGKVKIGGMHFLPQHLYVRDIDGRRVVEHVLRFENLDAEFASLVRRYGLPVELPGRNNARDAARSRLTTADLTTNTIAAINRRYVDDFRLFGYRMVTRATELSDPSPLPTMTNLSQIDI